jgi:hypothetical protein
MSTPIFLFFAHSHLPIHPQKLLSVKGFSDAKVNKIRQAASNEYNPLSFQTANTALSVRTETIRITTGSKELDKLLRGGVETESILEVKSIYLTHTPPLPPQAHHSHTHIHTQVYGEFRTGKTQFCHTLAVTAQLPRTMGGAEGKTIYLDTEGSFRPERIKEIATSYGLNASDVLDNIITARVYTSDHQMEILSQVVSMIAEDADSPYRLLIIDSIMALYRVDYSGRGELAYVPFSLSLSLSLSFFLSISLIHIHTHTHNNTRSSRIPRPTYSLIPIIPQRETTETCATLERTQENRFGYETCSRSHQSSYSRARWNGNVWSRGKTGWW